MKGPHPHISMPRCSCFRRPWLSRSSIAAGGRCRRPDATGRSNHHFKSKEALFFRAVNRTAVLRAPLAAEIAAAHAAEKAVGSLADNPGSPSLPGGSGMCRFVRRSPHIEEFVLLTSGSQARDLYSEKKLCRLYVAEGRATIERVPASKTARPRGGMTSRDSRGASRWRSAAPNRCTLDVHRPMPSSRT